MKQLGNQPPQQQTARALQPSPFQAPGNQIHILAKIVFTPYKPAIRVRAQPLQHWY